MMIKITWYTFVQPKRKLKLPQVFLIVFLSPLTGKGGAPTTEILMGFLSASRVPITPLYRDTEGKTYLW